VAVDVGGGWAPDSCAQRTKLKRCRACTTAVGRWLVDHAVRRAVFPLAWRAAAGWNLEAVLQTITTARSPSAAPGSCVANAGAQ